jgi:hypothetical protein
VIACVDTGSAIDTFQLGAVADINACRTNFYTLGAINAITFGALFLFIEFAPRFSTLVIVCYNNRVFVQQYTLQAAIRTNDDAYLFPEP